MLAQQNDLKGHNVRVDNKMYTLVKKLGAGGFGSVYSARDATGRKAALKVINIRVPQPMAHAFVESYLNEVRHLKSLRQKTPYVVKIYNFDFDPKTLRGYIAMELANGSLDKSIKKLHAAYGFAEGPGSFIPAAYRKNYWRQMVNIVASLHAHHTLHLDLKPDNFLDFGSMLKVADLGLSKKINVPGMGRIGTPFFGAPEVMLDIPGVQRYHSPKADVWSLGATLYFMTYGTVPGYGPGHPPHGQPLPYPPPGQAPTNDPYLLDILSRMLVMDPKYRISTNELLSHPYTVQ